MLSLLNVTLDGILSNQKVTLETKRKLCYVIKKGDRPMLSKRVPPLKEYLFFKGMTVSEFSDLMGYSRHHLSQVANGVVFPSNGLAKSIERVTSGEVKAEDLLREKPKRARPEKNRDNSQKKDDQQG